MRPKRPEVLPLGRWGVAVPAAEVDEPLAVGQLDDRARPRGVDALARGHDEDHGSLERVPVGRLTDERRIRHVAVDVGLGSGVEAQTWQPSSGAAVAPARVDHEIGGDRIFVAELHTHHPVVGGDRALDQRSVPQADVGHGRDTAADVQLELGSGLDVGHRAAVDGVRYVRLDAVGPSLWCVGVEVAAELHLHRSRVDEVVDEAGEPLRHRVEPAREQHVEVMPLRDRAAWLGRRRLLVPVEDDHLVEVIRQHTGREQPGHAATHHDCAVSEMSLLHHVCTPTCWSPERARPSQARRGRSSGKGHLSRTSHPDDEIATRAGGGWERARRRPVPSGHERLAFSR